MTILPQQAAHDAVVARGGPVVAQYMAAMDAIRGGPVVAMAASAAAAAAAGAGITDTLITERTVVFLRTAWSTSQLEPGTTTHSTRRLLSDLSAPEATV